MRQAVRLVPPGVLNPVHALQASGDRKGALLLAIHRELLGGAGSSRLVHTYGATGSEDG